MYDYEAVFYTKTPPTHLLECFDEICEDYYELNIRPHCYDNVSSAFYLLYDVCDYYYPDVRKELYDFVSKNTTYLEFEEM